METTARSAHRAATVLAAIGGLRVAVGLGLTVAPGVALRLLPGAQPSGTAALLLRTLGVRDVVVGLATLTAARRRDTRELSHWATVGVLSDTADGLAGILAARQLGRRGATVVAASPLPFLAAGGWVLRALRRGR